MSCLEETLQSRNIRAELPAILTMNLKPGFLKEGTFLNFTEGPG